MDIGQKIKEARLKKNMTQADLGKIVGVQKSAIAKYETGRVVNIKRSTLQKLALALDLKGHELIIENDPRQAATLHARVLMDNELMVSIEQYYELSEEKKKMVRDLIRNLAE